MNVFPFQSDGRHHPAYSFKPFNAGADVHVRRRVRVVFLAVSIFLGLIGVQPVQAQTYESPGGLIFNPGQTSTVTQSSGGTVPKSYASQTYTTNSTTGETTPVTEFNFQTFVDDTGERFVTMIGAVMPLMLKLLIPFLGFIFVMAIVRHLAR